MLTPGIILVILASIVKGWAGLLCTKMAEGRIEFFWLFLPANSLKAKFYRHLDTIAPIVILLSIILCITDSVLIGKETNLWVGSISFLVFSFLVRYGNRYYHGLVYKLISGIRL